VKPQEWVAYFRTQIEAAEAESLSHDVYREEHDPHEQGSLRRRSSAGGSGATASTSGLFALFTFNLWRSCEPQNYDRLVIVQDFQARWHKPLFNDTAQRCQCEGVYVVNPDVAADRDVARCESDRSAVK
jgi:hypothetical protein